jgi:hypothetical protein
MSTNGTTDRPGIYSMNQLSVKPDQIAIPVNLVLKGTYGHGEQEAMAALLITMCKENGNVWQGFSLSTITERVGEEHRKSRLGEGGFLFFDASQAQANFWVGLAGLKEHGMLQVEPDEDNSSFDVVFPTEKLLEPIQRLIRA